MKNWLKEVETTREVERMVLDDRIQVWPLLRVYLDIYFHSKNTARKVTAFSFTKKLNRARYLFLGLKHLFSKKPFLFFGDSLDVKMIHGRNRNKLMYAAIESLGTQQVHYFEKQLGETFFRDRDESLICTSTSAMDFLAYLISYILLPPKFNGEDLFKSIENELGVQLPHKRLLRLFLAYRLVYGALLRIKGPRKVFLTDYYNVSNMALVSVCHDLNIPTFEFQHGVINANHPAYSRYTDSFSGYLFPDYLLVFGDAFSKGLSVASFIPIERVLSVGNAYLNYLKEILAGPKASPYLDKNKKKVFAVALQWVNQDRVADFIHEAAKLNPEWLFVLIPRKGEALTSMDILPENVILEENLDFYEALRFADIHVTSFSTTALEALFHGKPNILLNFENIARDTYAELLKGHQVTQYIEAPEEFGIAVHKLLSMPAEQIKKEAEEIFEYKHIEAFQKACAKADPVKDIYQIEEKFPVERISSEGEQIWPALRIYYFFTLRNLDNNPSEGGDFHFLSRHIKRIFSLFKNVHRLIVRREYLCFSDSSEKKVFEGKLNNKMFYFLSDLLGADQISYFEKQIGNRLPKLPEGKPKSISTSLIDALAYALSFFVLAGKINGEDILQDIEQEIRKSINYRKIISILKSYRLLYALLLRYNRPKAIFMTDYYNLSHMAIVREAKKLGIPVVEFQHGIINKAHPAYNTNLKKFSPMFFPDYVFTFGPSVINEIRDSAFIDSSRFISIGHPFLSYLKNQTNGPVSSVKSNQYSAMLLITLQWTDEKQVIDFVKKVAPSTPDLEYVLLPRFWDPKKYTDILPRNARFEANYDFYSLLRVCDIHVTTYSTTAIEAPFFDKPNILLDFDGMATRYFGRMLSDSRYTSYVLTPEQFAQACREFHSSPEKISFESYDIFEPGNYEKKLSEELRKLGLFK